MNVTKNIKKIISMVMLFVMIISTFTVTAADEPKFTVSSQQIYSGGEAAITISVDKSVDIANLNFKLQYDTTAFETVTDADVVVSDVISNAGLVQIDKGFVNSGIITFTAFKEVEIGPDPTEGRNVNIVGPFTIVTIKFRAKSTAGVKVYPLVLDTVGTTLTTINSNDEQEKIPSLIVNGSIEIKARQSSGGNPTGPTAPKPSPTPSASPSPSASPTASPLPSVAPSAEPTSNPTPVFKDVSGWSEEPINYLASKGIINGRTNDTFEPKENITRAEFAKLIVSAFGIEKADNEATFGDVKEDEWYSDFVNIAASHGIALGYDDGNFKPDKEITREELCVMISRAAKLVGIDLPIGDLTFVDADQMEQWSKDAIAALAKAGIVNGKGEGLFDSKGNATREETAKIVYGIFKMFENK